MALGVQLSGDDDVQLGDGLGERRGGGEAEKVKRWSEREEQLDYLGGFKFGGRVDDLGGRGARGGGTLKLAYCLTPRTDEEAPLVLKSNKASSTQCKC